MCLSFGSKTKIMLIKNFGKYFYYLKVKLQQHTNAYPSKLNPIPSPTSHSINTIGPTTPTVAPSTQCLGIIHLSCGDGRKFDKEMNMSIGKKI